MIACDLLRGKFLDNWKIKERVASKRPYGAWLREHLVDNAAQPFTAERTLSDEALVSTSTDNITLQAILIWCA
jgi:glutamate synthase (ferredoxin)